MFSLCAFCESVRFVVFLNFLYCTGLSLKGRSHWMRFGHAQIRS